MLSRIAFMERLQFPLVLKYEDVRSYVFTIGFVALGVLAPWACHQFHLAGPAFLPMQYFVLLAGLLFGWRAGLVVGLLTPLTSYVISGMPAVRVLPQVAVEISAYGVIAGLLREKLNLRSMWSLMVAMVGGRLALLVAIGVVMLLSGESYSALGVASSPLLAAWAVVKQGWPGIVIQLASIPVVVFLIERLVMQRATFRDG
ncbi:MAG: ECF transporter S component [Chloroflexi bacterium]|nr:ECF transporter S component [Chloroflexota bacterium]MBM3172337.1 ECF transporter S component [Chloroflexota bacterium]MBM3175048.1 ECF transporter S component [Chloroflexota bacterium]MBM4449919.1 ECF transporter S component [Chloroflexota bacterium]